jgi:hypothetical protein
MIGCLVIQAGIYYGLVGLGATEQLIVTIEMIWLCATVLITLSVGERFAPK